jgi:hypothetical protein
MGRPKLPPGDRRTVRFLFRMRQADREWLDRYAIRTSRSLTDIIWAGLEKLAEEEGEEPPPPRVR